MHNHFVAFLIIVKIYFLLFFKGMCIGSCLDIIMKNAEAAPLQDQMASFMLSYITPLNPMQIPQMMRKRKKKKDCALRIRVNIYVEDIFPFRPLIYCVTCWM